MSGGRENEIRQGKADTTFHGAPGVPSEVVREWPKKKLSGQLPDVQARKLEMNLELNLGWKREGNRHHYAMAATRDPAYMHKGDRMKCEGGAVARGAAAVTGIDNARKMVLATARSDDHDHQQVDSLFECGPLDYGLRPTRAR